MTPAPFLAAVKEILTITFPPGQFSLMTYHRFSELLHFPEGLQTKKSSIFQTGTQQEGAQWESWGLRTKGTPPPRPQGSSHASGTRRFRPLPIPLSGPLPQLHPRPASGPPPLRFRSQPPPAALTGQNLKVSAGLITYFVLLTRAEDPTLTCDPSRSRERWRQQRPRPDRRGGAAPWRPQLATPPSGRAIFPPGPQSQFRASLRAHAHKGVRTVSLPGTVY